GGVAPLVSIPHIFTEAERYDRRKKRRLSFAVGTAAVLVTALLFTNADTPLDVRWVEFSRWLGLS
ncbi:MAG: hypothetical protein HY221_01745, partial [Candidatus Sungbacteria bacterium]|nr:hypothetical protein [Candidatus Sungbacteria bacterium]